MSIAKWSPPVELSGREKFVVSRLKRTGKLYVFLRQYRHELFDDSFQAELEAMYSDAPFGTAPKPPAMLAMVTLLQAYQQASDAAAVENAVLDPALADGAGLCGYPRKPLFSQGALVDFRRRLIEHDMDRRLLERTVELARQTGGFGHKALRVALDSAPLWGARRVEEHVQSHWSRHGSRRRVHRYRSRRNARRSAAPGWYKAPRPIEHQGGARHRLGRQNRAAAGLGAAGR